MIGRREITRFRQCSETNLNEIVKCRNEILSNNDLCNKLIVID